MGVHWIYQLKKEELIEHLERVNIDSSGTVRALRQRLVAFVKARPELFGTIPDPEDYKEEDDISKDEEVERLESEMTRVARERKEAQERERIEQTEAQERERIEQAVAQARERIEREVAQERERIEREAAQERERREREAETDRQRGDPGRGAERTHTAHGSRDDYSLPNTPARHPRPLTQSTPSASSSPQVMDQMRKWITNVPRHSGSC